MLSLETIVWLVPVVLKVALGLGMVIFVHELGHFLVAKACGVKCEKFFIGFDIPFGLLINRFFRREGEFTIFGLGIPRTIGWPIKVGETTYGIGIVPLGGYVSMFGQEDDPSHSCRADAEVADCGGQPRCGEENWHPTAKSTTSIAAVTKRRACRNGWRSSLPA